MQRPLAKNSKCNTPLEFAQETLMLNSATNFVYVTFQRKNKKLKTEKKMILGAATYIKRLFALDSQLHDL